LVQPVALDVLSLNEINRQRLIAGATVNNTNMDLYQNASLVEIGVSDTNHIKVDKLPSPPPAAIGPVAPIPPSSSK
jgi:hypothetical protein